MASKFEGSLALYPARALCIWYLGLVVGGGALLALPFSRTEDAEPIRIVDALFTATSACCVTGLSVRSTEFDFSIVGQCVILLLIQVGGIGIMTLTTFFLLSVGQVESLRHRSAMTATLGADPREDLRVTLLGVCLVTVLFELAGASLLVARYVADLPLGPAIWQAVFDAISAFNNAGFSMKNDSLVAYQGDAVVNLTVAALIITGGIGFPVILDLWRMRKQPWGRRFERLRLHTKLVLIGTAGLLLVGAAIFLALEWYNVLVGLPLETKLLAAFFQSTTARTAGFNTVDIGRLGNVTLFFLILWMMVGAAPCSTGGGYKVSTFMILLLQSLARFRGEPYVRVFRRNIPQDTVYQAVNTVFLFTAISTAGTALLLLAEEAFTPGYLPKEFFLQAVFEVVSAQATVGLSTGLTPHLSDPGKIILIVLMFVGRVGPVAVVVTLSRNLRSSPIQYPKEEVLLG